MLTRRRLIRRSGAGHLLLARLDTVQILASFDVVDRPLTAGRDDAVNEKRPIMQRRNAVVFHVLVRCLIYANAMAYRRKLLVRHVFRGVAVVEQIEVPVNDARSVRTLDNLALAFEQTAVARLRGLDVGFDDNDLVPAFRYGLYPDCRRHLSCIKICEHSAHCIKLLSCDLLEDLR